MTHSGGQPHRVGDEGQHYLVTVFDEQVGERIHVCYLEDLAQAKRISKSIVLRPSWRDAEILNRETNEIIEK